MSARGVLDESSTPAPGRFCRGCWCQSRLVRMPCHAVGKLAAWLGGAVVAAQASSFARVEIISRCPRALAKKKLYSVNKQSTSAGSAMVRSPVRFCRGWGCRTYDHRSRVSRSEVADALPNPLMPPRAPCSQPLKTPPESEDLHGFMLPPPAIDSCDSYDDISNLDFVIPRCTADSWQWLGFFFVFCFCGREADCCSLLRLPRRPRPSAWASPGTKIATQVAASCST